jgi:hypothetical protein
LFGRNRQGGSEGYHRPESAVEAENKLVEVCLQMLLAYTMMDSQQPCIEVPENDVYHGEVCLGVGLVPLDGERIVTVTELGEIVVAGPAILSAGTLVT